MRHVRADRKEADFALSSASVSLWPEANIHLRLQDFRTALCQGAVPRLLRNARKRSRYPTIHEMSAKAPKYRAEAEAAFLPWPGLCNRTVTGSQ